MGCGKHGKDWDFATSETHLAAMEDVERLCLYVKIWRTHPANTMKTALRTWSICLEKNTSRLPATIKDVKLNESILRTAEIQRIQAKLKRDTGVCVGVWHVGECERTVESLCTSTCECCVGQAKHRYTKDFSVRSATFEDERPRTYYGTGLGTQGLGPDWLEVFVTKRDRAVFTIHHEAPNNNHLHCRRSARSLFVHHAPRSPK